MTGTESYGGIRRECVTEVPEPPGRLTWQIGRTAHRDQQSGGRRPQIFALVLLRLSRGELIDR